MTNPKWSDVREIISTRTYNAIRFVYGEEVRLKYLALLPWRDIVRIKNLGQSGRRELEELLQNKIGDFMIRLKAIRPELIEEANRE